MYKWAVEGESHVILQRIQGGHLIIRGVLAQTCLPPGSLATAQLEAAQQITKRAIGELHPTLSKNEHEMFDAMLATTTASAVHEMKTELKDQTGAENAAKTVVKTKAKLFHSLINAVVAEVRIADADRCRRRQVP